MTTADLLTRKQAAERLGLSHTTLIGYIRSGQLRRANPDAPRTAPALFTVEDVDAFAVFWRERMRRDCATCGASFIADTYHERCCSLECRRQEINEKARKRYGFRAACERCEAEMPRTGRQADGTVGGRLWCESCRQWAKNEAQSKIYHGKRGQTPKPVRVCVCGKATRMGKGQYFCSDACKQEAIEAVCRSLSEAVAKGGHNVFGTASVAMHGRRMA